MKKVLILYIPVIHKGYIDLFLKYDGKVQTLYVLADNLVSEISSYKEIRSVDPYILRDLIKGLGFKFSAQVLTEKMIGKIAPSEIYTATDIVSKKFVKAYFPTSKVFYEDIFLRWDEKTVKSPLPPHYDSESSKSFDKKMMSVANKISKNSSDWWRRVGVVIVKGKKTVVKAYNQYLPSEHNPYIDGNPRDFIKAGTLGFLATSVHAEQYAISKAANLGKSLKGADLYLNSYPCPTCAKLMGIAGIKRCFFSGGNAYLNVDEVFKACKIKTILVKEK